MIIIDERMPFLWEIDIDIHLVSLPVGDLHGSNGIAMLMANDNMQSTMTVKAFHSTCNSLILLIHDCFLFSVVGGLSGLTAFISEPFG